MLFEIIFTILLRGHILKSIFFFFASTTNLCQHGNCLLNNSCIAHKIVKKYQNNKEGEYISNHFVKYYRYTCKYTDIIDILIKVIDELTRNPDVVEICRLLVLSGGERV